MSNAGTSIPELSRQAGEGGAQAAAPKPVGEAPLLAVQDLAKHYPVRRGLILARQVGTVRAVDGVSFTLNRGETLALVGESGCGKSTTARLVLRLIEPSAGHIAIEGEDITRLSGAALRRLRRRAQIIFQDPYASLNPRLSVGDAIAEPMVVHGIGNAATRAARVRELLGLVGLAAYHADRYPHEFSGGQRQRIGIARALAVQPELVVCDEPVSALDVSIQAQVVNLLKELQARFGLAYLFIAHDLAVVKHMADRVAVMYLGRIVEIAEKRALFAAPRHPYTRALLAAIPHPDPGRRGKVTPLGGDVPSPMAIPPGCRFHTRCPHAAEICRQQEPPALEVAPGHLAACHFAATLPPADMAVGGGLSPRAAQRLALFAAGRRGG
ncbi:dipeptide ABC transporter ATP-binding protein [Siccirubricoccus sp. KC 17139]|uniref:Dipeptide ABC transporter ATP-binding protein n=1 Tax=Siccirubricoccus soli TaxID=2899147 RepID=A0ABT1D549_9PROT|nr:dipeptide ABC transporter ATP-binding protein [Siccirubricoccus soli]MCO6417051.1 dipeptide ABC transporter ATP-binding protein [Siccirubricoccus soli]MCP2683186.1 dipeptide ABC transporter ATP-binding protein [Siccirubricoccus soli]